MSGEDSSHPEESPTFTKGVFKVSLGWEGEDSGRLQRLLRVFRAEEIYTFQKGALPFIKGKRSVTSQKYLLKAARKSIPGIGYKGDGFLHP